MRRHFSLAGFVPLLSLAAVAWCAPASAQETLVAGRWVSGVLQDGDATNSAGMRYDVYRIRGGTPGLLSITAESDAFDTFLELGILVDGEFTKFVENDDFRGLSHPTDSRIYVEGDNDWEWELRVSSWAADEAGEYRVGVEILRGGEPVPQSTAYGADIRGSLDESDGFAFQSFQDWYRFRGTAGDRVKAVLEADFDAYLIVRPVNGSRLAEDDDGFGRTDAYVEALIPSDGTYEVIVRAATPGLGDYRLRLGPDLDVEPPAGAEEDPGPPPVVQASGAEEALPVGEWVEGSLDEGDARDVEGRVFDGFYAPVGEAGVFAVTVESGVFDAVVEAGPSAQGRYTAFFTADDFPGLSSPTDARLYLGTQVGQPFEVRVFSALGDAAGDYRIRVDPAEVGEGDPEYIDPGADVSGTLEEGDAFVFGSFLDRYLLVGHAGDVVEIALEGEFDPYLAVGMVGGGGLAQDDNSLDGRGAYLGVVLPEDGQYEIQVSAARSGTGSYRLRVGRGLRPETQPPVTEVVDGPPFTEEDRQALVRDGDRFRNDLLGFEFPAPSATIAPVPGAAAAEGVESLHTWYLAEADASRQVMVIAHRNPGGAAPQALAAFAEGLVGSLPFRLVEARPAWVTTRSADYLLEAPNGVRAEFRCQASPAAQVPGLTVCLLATATDGSSFERVLSGLEVGGSASR